MNFGSALLGWFAQNKRELPWRINQEPYRVWVSEIMLQQTRVEAAIEPYQCFLDRFPSIAVLGDALQEQVLRQWQGLGYYSRARNLHQAANILVQTNQGQFPQDYGTFRTLPGVGEYTANAVFSISFGQPLLALDANLLRIGARLFGIEGDLRRVQNKRKIGSRLTPLLPTDQPGDFNQALMDLGSGICVSKHPRCDQCPVETFCFARVEGLQDLLPSPQTRPYAVPMTVQVDYITNERGELLLRQRSTAGFLQGMWELPWQEGDSVAEPRPGLTWKGEFWHKYLFSHRHWQMHVRHFSATGSFTPEKDCYWFPATEQEQLPMATVFRQVLRKVADRRTRTQ